MSPRFGSRAGGRDGDDLTTRAQTLDEALLVGGGHLDPAAVTAARATVDKMTGRLSFGGAHTVVALAGATGGGKSSVFNALVGAPVARPGVRRPTTDRATAAIWGPEPADELLDWLGVPTRHAVPPAPAPDDRSRRDTRPDLDGLVLLDLPDFDSRELANRAEADRVLDLADVFVWITDPQKYADAVLHQQYLAAAARRQPVMLAVLNQADRLPRDALTHVLADLRRLIVADGFEDVDVLATSTVGPPGVEPLRTAIATVVAERTAVRQRLTGDLREAATTLRAGVGDREPELGDGSARDGIDARVVAALADAAGVGAVVHAVERDFRDRARARGGWPFTRWLGRLRPDPLRRLGLQRQEAKDSRVELRRSSIPAPSPAQQAAVQLALQDLGDRAAAGLPLRWAQGVERAAEPEPGRITDGLDQAVMKTSLETRRPLWWPVVSVLQWIFALTVLAGVGWLLVLVGLGWAQIHVTTPSWGPFPYPVLLIVVGAVLGLATAAGCRWAAVRGAQRRGRQVRRRLESAIRDATATLVLDPVRAVLDQHRRTRELLDRAAR